MSVVCCKGGTDKDPCPCQLTQVHLKWASDLGIFVNCKTPGCNHSYGLHIQGVAPDSGIILTFDVTSSFTCYYFRSLNVLKYLKLNYTCWLSLIIIVLVVILPSALKFIFILLLQALLSGRIIKLKWMRFLKLFLKTDPTMRLQSFVVIKDWMLLLGFSAILFVLDTGTCIT
jgi:hypothetical protein